MSGILWAVGAPQHGKTYSAVAVAAALSSSSGWPVVAVEGVAGEKHLARWPAVELEAMPDALWRERRSVRVHVEDRRQLQQVVRGVRAGGQVVLLIDEVAIFNSARRPLEDLLTLCRVHRHRRVAVVLTAQHFGGDVSRAAMSLAPEILFHRVADPVTCAELRKVHAGLAASLPTLEKRRKLWLTGSDVVPDPEPSTVAATMLRSYA